MLNLMTSVFIKKGQKETQREDSNVKPEAEMSDATTIQGLPANRQKLERKGNNQFILF